MTWTTDNPSAFRRFRRDLGCVPFAADRLDAAHKREVDTLAKLIEDLRSQRDMWYDKAEELRTALQKN